VNIKNFERMKNIENKKFRKNNKLSIGQRILQWLKRNFTATVIGIMLSIIGIILTLIFDLKGCGEDNEPFTATIEVYGWEGEQHNPLEGKGSIVLILGDKTEKAEINRQGEALFNGIPPEYNGKFVSAYITDTESEPYYLSDSIIKIQKNRLTKVQVLLEGLEKLQGEIFDETGINGLSGVKILVAGQETTTDEWGHFSIDIPRDRLKRIQLVEAKKQGYVSNSWNFDMTGKLEKKLEKQK